MKFPDDDIKEKGYQNILVYLSRTDSVIDFINAKIINLKNKLFGEFETEEILEAFVIKILCDWELHIEQMFSYCISKNTKSLSNYLGLELPEIISIDESTALLNGIGYFDIKNTGNLKSLSKKILVPQYNLFMKINNSNCKFIDEFYVIRNYIAHKSKSSKRSLMNMYKNNYNIQNFIEPGKFLLMYDETSKELNFNYFNSYMIVFTLATLEMWEFLFPKSFASVTEKDGSFSPQSMIKIKQMARFREPAK